MIEFEPKSGLASRFLWAEGEDGKQVRVAEMPDGRRMRMAEYMEYLMRQLREATGESEDE